MTYSGKNSRTQPSQAQQEFWELHGRKNADTSNDHVSLRQDKARRTTGTPAIKRRKTEHSSPRDVIALSDDDEAQESTPHSAVSALGAKEHSRPQSAYSTRSWLSAGSERARKGEQSGSQPANEFKRTESMIKAACGTTKASARKNDAGRQSRGASRGPVSGSTTPRAQDSVEHALDDESSVMSGLTRTSILQNFQQGVSDAAPASSKHEETGSHHFPNARINESTVDFSQQVANKRQSGDNNEGKRLGTFRRANDLAHADPISDDELSMDVQPSRTQAPKRGRSASKSTQLANSGAKRNIKPNTSSHVWPLSFARSHDFDSQQMPPRTDGKCTLQLKSDTDGKTWRIVGHDEQRNFATKLIVKAEQVIRAYADDVCRIRLEGSRSTDGIIYTVDLLISDEEDFREVRDKYVPRLIDCKGALPKDEAYMQKLFSKPLPRNDKVGTTPLVDDATPEVSQSTSSGLYSGFDWNRTRAASRSTNGIPQASGAKLPRTTIGTVRPSTRPARATRATAPMHDTDFAPLSREVEKFSIESGLGPRWLRPLTYGEGRMRATVDFNDLSRLDEEEFLNDSLIDFYMIYLFNQSKMPEEKVFFFNTFFFTKLTQNTGRESSINYRAVERWTSKLKDGIFGYDYIVIPINEDTHWYLAVICNVKNIPRQAIQEDFDGGAAQKAVNESNVAAKPVTTVEAGISETLQLTDAGTTPTSAQQAIAEQEQDQPDANLFENAHLELIDRDDMGTGLQESQAGPENSSVPQSPYDASNRTTGSIFDQTTLPKTVLSNLHASPEKKKPKRRSMAIKKDPYQPVIIILDSLGHTRSPTVRALKDWVAAEGKEKRGIDAVIKEKGFYPKSDQIPTQSNFTDCGVYLLGYAEKFFQDPDEFKRKLLTGEMTADKDWPELKPKDMRKNLRDIIFELAKEQKLTESMKKKKKKTKQPVTLGDPSLTEPGTAAPSPGVPAPPQRESEAPLSVGVEGASKDAVLAQAGHEDLKNEHSSVSKLPRLGSPFSPQKRSKLSASAEEPNGTSMEDLVASSAPVSTIEATSGSSRSNLTAAKPIDLEVHTSRRSPALTHPQSDDQIQTASSRLDGFPKQLVPVSRSVSPLKRLRQTADEDAAEPLAERRSISPKPRSASSMSPSTRAPQDGHASQPIEIEDSQESKLAAMQSPPRSNLTCFTPRDQPPQALHRPQTLRHEASLKEITASPPHTAQPKRGQPGNHFIGDQLEAKLDADDLQRRQSIRPSTLGFPSRAEESDLDAMEIDSQGADPMDMAEDAVRETPTPKRSSPSALDFGVHEF